MQLISRTDVVADRTVVGKAFAVRLETGHMGYIPLKKVIVEETWNANVVDAG